MQFERFQQLRHHGTRAIIPCSANIVSVCRRFEGVFIFLLV